MLRQASSYLAANMVSAAFGFAAVIIFTRALTPEEYGVYVVGFGTAALISSVLFGWLKSSVVPLTAKGDGTDLRLTATVAYAGITLIIPPLYFGMHVAVPGMSNYLLPTILLAFAIGLFEFCLETFRARQETLSYATATILRAGAGLVMSLLLVLGLGWGGSGLLVSIGFSYVLTSAVFAGLVWRGPRKPFDVELFRAMIGFGVPMTVSGAVFTLQSLLDRFVVASQMGENAAGIYGASADLVRQVMLFPGVAIGSVIAPIALRLLAQGAELVRRHLVQSTELLLGVLVPATAGLAIVADKLAFAVFGENFRAAGAVLIPVIAIAWLLRSISFQLMHVSFQITRRPGLMVVQGLVTITINAVCLFLMIPRFGLEGAAWAVVVSELLGVGVGFALTYRAYPFPLDVMPWLRVGLATCAMAVPTFFIDRYLTSTGLFELAVTVMSGVALYGLAAFVLDIAGVRSRSAQWSGVGRISVNQTSK